MRVIIFITGLVISLLLWNACNTASNETPSTVEPTTLAPSQQETAAAQATETPNKKSEPSELSSKSNVKGQKVSNEQRNEIIKKARASATPKSTKMEPAERIKAKAKQLAEQFCQCKTKKDSQSIGACKRRVEKMVDRAWTNLADNVRDSFKEQYNAGIKACN